MDKEKKEWFDGLVFTVGTEEAAATNIISIQKCDGCGEWRDAARTEESWIEEHYPHRDMIKKESHDDGVMQTSTLQFDEPEKVDSSIWLMPNAHLPTVDESGNVSVAYQCPTCKLLRAHSLSLAPVYCVDCQQKLSTLHSVGVRGVLSEQAVPLLRMTNPPKGYEYTPQKDITVYELALIIPVITSGGFSVNFDDLSDEIKRHFTEIEDE